MPHKHDQVRIQIVITSSNNTTTEKVWARHLGDDLYEINSPLHLVVGVHLHDIVRAKRVSEESIPSMIEIVKRSGYKTLHVLFMQGVSDKQQRMTLESLRELGAEEERPFESFYTIVLSPDANYQTVVDYLNSQTRRGSMIYEPNVPLSVLLRSRFTPKRRT